MNELILQKVRKDFNNKRILDNINIKLENGVYGLLGANGAGKTTLMKIICGILKKTEGDILYNEISIEKIGREYRKKIGYLPQNFEYYQEYTAINFLLYMAILKDLSESKARNAVMKLLNTVGLYEERNKKLKCYSGGMIRRIGIAQALLNDPQILILDEPTSGLDPLERVRFRNIISDLGKEKIILFSTHIISDIEYIADKILMMNNGKIVAEGSINEILKPIRNIVWEIELEDSSDYIKSNFSISSVKKHDGMTKMRIISKETPILTAVQVEPNLEDAYLYYRNID